MPGVYLSYPFCAQKCTYCNFASGVFPKELEAQYEGAMRAEIQRHRWEWTPETVYIGGGTPSRWDGLPRILDLIPGRPWREATIEAAPGDLTLDRLRRWKDAGIHRISFGVQSFVETELRQTGRRHSAETVRREVGMLRAEGIGNFNLDLIAGLPHQTPRSFEVSLDWIRRLDPPHVSVYMLEVDEDSRLGAEILSSGSRYGAPAIPTDEAIVEMYELANTTLTAQGIRRYEISNFAKPGFESVHNLKYWRLEPYAGFGADAHSFDGVYRWENVETAAEYISGWREPTRTPTRLEEERFLTGLRLTQGIALSATDRLKHGAAIEKFTRQGWLATEDGYLRFTGQGILYSNDVLQEFLET